ncbi:hypothetical protein LTR65_005156 [Meristemomyces frigidus]
MADNSAAGRPCRHFSHDEHYFVADLRRRRLPRVALAVGVAESVAAERTSSVKDDAVDRSESVAVEAAESTTVVELVEVASAADEVASRGITVSVPVIGTVLEESLEVGRSVTVSVAALNVSELAVASTDDVIESSVGVVAADESVEIAGLLAAGFVAGTGTTVAVLVITTVLASLEAGRLDESDEVAWIGTTVSVLVMEAVLKSSEVGRLDVLASMVELRVSVSPELVTAPESLDVAAAESVELAGLDTAVSALVTASMLDSLVAGRLVRLAITVSELEMSDVGPELSVVVVVESALDASELIRVFVAKFEETVSALMVTDVLEPLEL